MVDQTSRIDEITTPTIMLYEINPDLNPKILPIETCPKYDGNYGISD